MAPVIRGNSLYTIVDGPSWTQAEANSVALGGHLVTVGDENENSFLQVFNNNQNNGATNWKWIGLNDKDVEGQFRWISGETSFYRQTNWIPDDNKGFDSPQGQDYVAIQFYGVHILEGGMTRENPHTTPIKESQKSPSFNVVILHM